jgi:hypothetical protein
MLAHGFDPVQTERMQHGAGSLHDAQDAHGQDKPEPESEHNHHRAETRRLLLESTSKGHLPQNDGKLLVSERQGPKTEVRRSVGDTVQAEF